MNTGRYTAVLLFLYTIQPNNKPKRVKYDASDFNEGKCNIGEAKNSSGKRFGRQTFDVNEVFSLAFRWMRIECCSVSLRKRPDFSLSYAPFTQTPRYSNLPGRYVTSSLLLINIRPWQIRVNESRQNCQILDLQSMRSAVDQSCDVFWWPYLYEA